MFWGDKHSPDTKCFLYLCKYIKQNIGYYNIKTSGFLYCFFMSGVYNALMLTEKDLMLIGALIDAKLDARFDAFEVKMELKMVRIIDERFQEFEKKFDDKLYKLEERIYMRMDEKFDEFAGIIKKSFDEVFLRLDENRNEPEDHPSWR